MNGYSSEYHEVDEIDCLYIRIITRCDGDRHGGVYGIVSRTFTDDLCSTGLNISRLEQWTNIFALSSSSILNTRSMVSDCYIV